MTDTYVSLIAGGVSTRDAAALTGTVRSTAARRHTAATAPTPAVSAPPAPDPANKLTDLERRRVLEVLTSDRFVDLAPLQIYAQLLDEGLYLCSVSTMYRVLAANSLVAERRRVVEVLTSDRFVDLAPLQIYAQLLDEGVYLCSVSSSAGGFKGSGGQQRGGHVKARSNVGLRRVARRGSTFV